MSLSMSANGSESEHRTYGQRRGSPTSPGSSSESTWSPPDTPTPVRYLPLPQRKKARLQAGCVDKRTEFGFTVPTVQRAPKRVRRRNEHVHRQGPRGGRPSYALYRENETDTEVDTDGEATETEMGTALSGVESQICAPDESVYTAELDGDDVDAFLLTSPSAPSSPQTGWSDWKGKKRARQWDDDDVRKCPARWDGMVDDLSDRDGEGDDEMETEGMLRVRAGGKGKRPMKSARKLSYYPTEKSESSFSVVDNICQRMDGLHAASTMFAMNLDAPLQGSSGYPPEKEDVKVHSDYQAYQAASRRAGAGVRQTRKRGHNGRKGGSRKAFFSRLTASEDPFVTLPAFQAWRGLKSSPKSDGSSMDISDAEDQSCVDAELRAVSPRLSDIDMRSSSSASVTSLNASVRHALPDRTKVRALYEPALPLNKVQLAAVEQTLSNPARGIHRRPRYRPHPERVPGQASTSQLHRRSPSTLLPARRYMTRSHRPSIAAGHRAEAKFGRSQFTTCFAGQTFLALIRARLVSQRERQQRVGWYNAQTQNGEWRKMIGTWRGHSQVAQLVDRWWLNLAPAYGSDDVEVENLLLHNPSQEDQVMRSPIPAALRELPITLNESRKRGAQEVLDDDRKLGTEYEDRWARRNELRTQELKSYRHTVRTHRQALRAEQRRAEMEAIAERRRAEEVRRREVLRILHEEEERRRSEERREREEQERQREEALRVAREAEQAETERQRALEAEAELLVAPPSPSPTESSTLSDPPEYEYPFFPVVRPRPGLFNGRLEPAFVPMPRSRSRGRIAASDVLPAYVPDRWTNRSPPPPPPYNATTDCQTLIAPVFIEDEDEDDTEDEGDDDLAMASPSIPSRRRSISPGSESEVEMVGAFPAHSHVPRHLQPHLHVHAPAPVRHSVDPVRAFEAALDLEEGDMAEEMEDIERAFALDDEEEDVVPGGTVAGVFQRVFGMVWGGRR